MNLTFYIDQYRWIQQQMYRLAYRSQLNSVRTLHQCQLLQFYIVVFQNILMQLQKNILDSHLSQVLNLFSEVRQFIIKFNPLFCLISSRIYHTTDLQSNYTQQNNNFFDLQMCDYAFLIMSLIQVQSLLIQCSILFTQNFSYNQKHPYFYHTLKKIKYINILFKLNK